MNNQSKARTELIFIKFSEKIKKSNGNRTPINHIFRYIYLK